MGVVDAVGVIVQVGVCVGASVGGLGVLVTVLGFLVLVGFFVGAAGKPLTEAETVSARTGKTSKPIKSKPTRNKKEIRFFIIEKL